MPCTRFSALARRSSRMPARKLSAAAPISTFWPLEAVHLYYPQTHFFSSPYWGHACSGFTLEGGTKPMPLRLRLQAKEGIVETVIANGISTGMGKPLTWHAAEGCVSDASRCSPDFRSGFGDKGRVEFTVLGDGKPLATSTVNGTDPAHAFECDICGRDAAPACCRRPRSRCQEQLRHLGGAGVAEATVASRALPWDGPGKIRT